MDEKLDIKTGTLETPKIDNLIIHEVSREKNGEPLKEVYRKVQNDTTTVASHLTEKLTSLFASATLNIGQFALDGDITKEPSFEIELRKWQDGTVDFVTVTEALARLYKKNIEPAALNSVKGGLVIFYSYIIRNKKWIAVAIVERTSAINADSDLNLLLTQIIDLDKLHLGASINITDWESNKGNRYIRFKTGSAASVRDYFEKFIGCQRDKSAAKKETSNLRKAIRDYAKATGLNDEQTQGKVNEANQYIKDTLKNHKELKLSNLAKKVFEETSDDFVVTAKKYDLGEDIAVDQAELRKYIRISVKSKDFNLSFDRSLLDKTIEYKDGKLIICNIPEDLKREIDEELAERAKERLSNKS